MLHISLRLRVLLIAALAVVALGAALLAIVKLRAESAAARERDALDRSDAAIAALTQTVLANPSFTPGSLEAPSPAIRAALESIAAPLTDAHLGYCDADGAISLLIAGPPSRVFQWPDPPRGLPRSPDEGRRGPHKHQEKERQIPTLPQGHAGARPPHLPPADRDAIAAVCRSARGDRIEHARVELPRDILLLGAQSARSPLVAWALVRLPPERADPEGAEWAVNIGVMGLSTLLLVLLAMDALLALRRGALDLRGALRLLEQDLRAPVALPRTEELARIAQGLQVMATHLADAHERERGLLRQLSHEQRLAGLGRVVAGLAHEVRNPLTGIKLKLDTMARRRLDDRSARDVATCQQEIVRLDRVVSSLLLVARKGPVDKEEIDLGELVDERLQAADALAQGYEVRLEREGSARALGNREALTRVLDNLVRNAIEASPKGAEVRVRLERDEAEVRIDVLDQGDGIPPDRVPELFEPFFTLKPEGTGLGLFLSRSLIEAHGGRLVYARDALVTRFGATLPTHE